MQRFFSAVIFLVLLTCTNAQEPQVTYLNQSTICPEPRQISFNSADPNLMGVACKSGNELTQDYLILYQIEQNNLAVKQILTMQTYNTFTGFKFSPINASRCIASFYRDSVQMISFTLQMIHIDFSLSMPAWYQQLDISPSGKYAAVLGGQLIQNYKSIDFYYIQISQASLSVKFIKNVVQPYGGYNCGNDNTCSIEFLNETFLIQICGFSYMSIQQINQNKTSSSQIVLKSTQIQLFYLLKLFPNSQSAGLLVIDWCFNTNMDFFFFEIDLDKNKSTIFIQDALYNTQLTLGYVYPLSLGFSPDNQTLIITYKGTIVIYRLKFLNTLCNTTTDLIHCKTCIEQHYSDDLHYCNLKCDKKCRTCQNITSCDTCPLSTLARDIRNFCKCPAIGTYDLGDDSCHACPFKGCATCNQVVCFTCLGSTNQVSSRLLPTCGCPQGYFDKAPDIQECQICSSPYCLLCSDQVLCSACIGTPQKDYSRILPWCDCPDGYYSDLNKSKECIKCPLRCLTCFNSSVCITCKSEKDLTNSRLPNKACICPDFGYVDTFAENDAKTYSCIPCEKTNCKSCKQSICTACSGSNRNLSDNCQCQQGHYLQTTQNTAQCLPCQSECKQCLATQPTYCTSCFTERQFKLVKTQFGQFCQCEEGLLLIYSGAKSEAYCVSSCPAQTYTDTQKSLCIACAPNCLNCNDKHCLFCQYGFCLAVNESACTLDCETGTFKNTQTKKCTPCTLPNCKLCDTLAESCLQCVSTTFVLYDKQCTLNSCPQGTYEYFNATIGTKICIKCPFACTECTITLNNEIRCNACATNFIFSQPEFRCSCKAGQYLDMKKESCLKCQSQCSTCDQEPSSCTTCAANRASPPQCPCLNAFYYDEIFAQCLPCSEACSFCSNAPSFCTKCAGKNRIEPSCQCAPGYFSNDYVSSASQACLQCESKCSLCQYTASTCFQCNVTQNRAPQPPDCPCNTGFYEDQSSGQCLHCYSKFQHCVRCNAASCQECDQTAYLMGSECVAQCPYSYEPVVSEGATNGCMCALCQPSSTYSNCLQEYLTLQVFLSPTVTNRIIMQFSYPLVQIQSSNQLQQNIDFRIQELSSKDFEIAYLQMEGNDKITGQLLFKNPQFKQHVLEIEFKNSSNFVALNTEGKQIYLKDLNGYEMTVEAPPSELIQQLVHNSQYVEDLMIALQSLSLAGILVISAIAYPVIESIQALVFLIFINVRYPPHALAILQLMSVFMFRNLPNLLQNNQYQQISLFDEQNSLPEFLGVKILGQEPPETFKTRVQLTSSYLINGLAFYWTCLLLLALVKLVQIFIKYSKNYLKQSKNEQIPDQQSKYQIIKSLRRYLKIIYDSMHYSGIVSLMISDMLPQLTFVFLQLQNFESAQSNEKQYYSSLGMTLSALSLMILIYFVHKFYKIVVNEREQNYEQFKKLYGGIIDYLDYENNKLSSTQRNLILLWPFWQCTNKILYSLIIVFLYSVPQFQIMLLMILFLFQFYLIVNFKPFKSRSNYVRQLSNDLAVLILLITLLVIQNVSNRIDKEKDYDTLSYLYQTYINCGWIIFIVIVLVLCANFIDLVVETFKMIKAYYNKRQNKNLVRNLKKLDDRIEQKNMKNVENEILQPTQTYQNLKIEASNSNINVEQMILEAQNDQEQFVLIDLSPNQADSISNQKNMKQIQQKEIELETKNQQHFQASTEGYFQQIEEEDQ